LQNLILFPHVGRLQKAEGVRKIVTRKYMIDELADEIVILSVKHPAQEREHSDA
jgi:toxin ParE1/3/4